MASDHTAGDLAAEFLTARGVAAAFGIAQVHNIPMLDIIGRRDFIIARLEPGGARMAGEVTTKLKILPPRLRASGVKNLCFKTSQVPTWGGSAK